jgi:hypothetical protein
MKLEIRSENLLKFLKKSTVSISLTGNADDAGKAAQQNLAQCIAALCHAAGPQKTATTVQSLLAVLQVIFAILYMGSANLYRRTSISGTTFSGKKCLRGTIFHAI